MLCQVGSEVDVYNRLSIRLEGGTGCEVWDDKGKKYIDLYGGHAVAGLGYNHPELTEAIASQASNMVFQSNAVDLAVREEACARLGQLAPPGLNHVFLINSGAEAIENALRIAFGATGRSRVTALRGAFHGRTAAAAAITDWGGKPYGLPRTPFEVDWLNPEDRAGVTQAINSDTACVVFEPVQGVAGAVDLSEAFVAEISARAREVGACVIADEVQTGNGRTGTYFACEGLGLVPDILVTAKALGGGFPAAAVCMTATLAAGLGRGSIASTFGGGPMACAAMLAVMQAVTAPGFLTGVQTKSQLLRDVSRAAGVEKISGKGFLLGLHVGQPASYVREKLLELGFITGDAKKPDVVRLLPPLILSEAEIEAFGMALRSVLK